MSEFSRGGGFKPTKTTKFYVTNRGSDSDGSVEDRGLRQPPNGRPYLGPRRMPLPTPPIVTQARYGSRYEPSLSSASSSSSPAADDSTPPPPTPGPSLSSTDSPSDQLVADVAPLSTPRKIGAPTMMPPYHRSTSSHPHHPPTLTVPRRRPSTSPTVSTPENLFSPSSTSSTSSDRVHIFVRADSDTDRYVNVDITGARSAAFIRERVFSKLNIYEEHEQNQYSIYHTEVGALAVGDSLSDDRLLELCLKHGDSKGSLKLLVSHPHDPLPDTPPRPHSSMSGTPTLLPPVVIPPYTNAASCAPLRPRRRSGSRPDSVSSSDQPQMEPSLSAGYEADVDNPERTAFRPLPSISPATPSSPRRGRNLHGPMPRPPSPGHLSRSDSPSQRITPIGTEYTTIRDRYGNILPTPPPPPPLNSTPEKQSFVVTEGPSRPGRSARASSDVADRDAARSMLPSPEQQGLPASLPQRASHIHRVKENQPTRERKRRPQRADSDGVEQRSGNGDTAVADARNAPSSSSKLRQQVSPSTRYNPTSPYPSRPIPVITKSSRNNSNGGAGLSPETRTGGGNHSRQAGQPVPPNWAVAWKGEGTGAQKVVPSSPSYSRMMKGAKSMDNLRNGTHPTALQPGSTRRSGQSSRGAGALPVIQQSKDSALSNTRGYDSRPGIRPLPSLGQSSPAPSSSAMDLGITSAIRIPNRNLSPTTIEPYPRPLSAFGDALNSPSRFLQSPTHMEAENHVRTARGSPMTNPLPIAPIRSRSRPREMTSPPLSPISPRSPPDSSVDTFKDDHTWVFPIETSQEAKTTKPPLVATPLSLQIDHQQTNGKQRFSNSSSSSSEESESGTGTALWQVPPTMIPSSSISRPPPLKVRTHDQDATYIPPSSSTSTATLMPQRRPPTAEARDILDAGSREVKREANENAFDWVTRPPPEVIYERLDKSFPKHDLDKPVIDAGSGETSPSVTVPPAAFLMNPPPVAPLNPDKSKSRAKKSIRYVAQEHKKRIDRTSRIDPASSAENMARKRSTQLWDNKLEEVTAEQLQRVPAHDSPNSASSPGTEGTLKWVRGELIGKGTYGKVYLALNMLTGEVIAVKQVELPRTESERNDSRQITVVQALKMESDTLRELDHPNIVQYLGFEETPTNLSIFLEYVPGGSIGSCLLKHGRFSEDVTKSFMAQILGGLDYLHSKGIVHRDLKADNILVEETGVCKISDFGISKRTTDYGGAATAMQGTVFWMAPEVVNPQGKVYGFKVDIWSVGCVVLEMWAGFRPWQGDEMFAVMFKLYNQKLPPPVPEGIILTDLADNFRKLCFAVNPDERPTAAELRKHRYLELTPGWVFDGNFT